MTQRNQVGCVLGTHDAGKFRRRENVTFFHCPCPNQFERFFFHPHFAFGDGDALGVGFRAHVYHLGATLGVNVRECGHRRNYSRIVG